MADKPLSPTGDPQLDRVMSALRKQTERFGRVGRDLAETRGRGEAADGLVVVEVSSAGCLAGVRIAPDAMDLGPEGLAEAITVAAKHAEQDVAGRANQAMETFLDEE